MSGSCSGLNKKLSSTQHRVPHEQNGMELRNLVTIPVIFHFVWVRTTSIPYEVYSSHKAIHNWPKSLNKVIHQLDLFCLKNDHYPSIRWLAGEEQYLWDLAPDWSSCWLLWKTHCMKVHVQSTFLCLQTTQLLSTCHEPLAPFETNVLRHSLWRRANPRNVSFLNLSRW